jgi:hypothetical protein
MKNEDLTIFRNLIIEPRYNSYKGPKYTKIEVTLKNEESIILPVSDSGIYGSTLENRFRTEIERWAKLNKVSQDSASNFAVLYVADVMKRFYKFNAYATEGYPDLGEFIIFTVSSGCTVVYCPDTTKVKYDYWKFFFKNTKQIEQGWYRKLD